MHAVLSMGHPKPVVTVQFKSISTDYANSADRLGALDFAPPALGNENLRSHANCSSPLCYYRSCCLTPYPPRVKMLKIVVAAAAVLMGLGHPAYVNEVPNGASL